MSLVDWLAIGIAAATAALSPLILRPILERSGTIDAPNARSSHSIPTLRGGGSAQLLGLLFGATVGVVHLRPDADSHLLLVTMTAGVLVAIVGLIEDMRGLHIFIRAGFQFLIGLSLAAALIPATTASWLWTPVAALGFAAYVNFANFMDGINGISSLHGLVVGLAYAGIGAVLSIPWLILGGSMVAAAFLAFIPWNVRPPGMFLGDVGSYLLGGVLSSMAIAALFTGVAPIVVLSPLSIYLADTILTLTRRSLKGDSLTQAHRSHVYQRLTDTGLSHLAVALIVTALSAGTAVTGLFVAAERLSTAAAAMVIACLVAVYLLLPNLRGHVAPSSFDNALVPAEVPRPVHERSTFHPQSWAVVGSTGFIGSAITTHLRKTGADVLCVTAPRVELDPSSADGGAVATIADRHAATAPLAHQLAHIDVVINAAGLALPGGTATKELYGANALLPAIVAHASIRADASRVIHLSSAAVQGQRALLDTSPDTEPFSAYSRSKALGEKAILSISNGHRTEGLPTDLIIIRATSVQGPGRRTTEQLRRIASSPLASVAAPGSHPTVVSSVEGLVDFTLSVGLHQGQFPSILLQPWEGLTVSEVLQLAGGRAPRQLPYGFCRVLLALGKVAARVVPEVVGVVRRLELMWFGQAQVLDSAEFRIPPGMGRVRKHLTKSDGEHSDDK